MFRIVGLEKPVICFSKDDVSHALRLGRDVEVAIHWSSLSGTKGTRWVHIDNNGLAYSHSLSDKKPFNAEHELPPINQIMASW